MGLIRFLISFFFIVLFSPCTVIAVDTSCVNAVYEAFLPDYTHVYTSAGTYSTQNEAENAFGGGVAYGANHCIDCGVGETAGGVFQGTGTDPILKIKYANVAYWDSCPPPDVFYCLTKLYECTDGTDIGYEYARCDGQEPDEYSYCGNLDLINSIDAGWPCGTVTVLECNCALKLAEVQAACALLDDEADCTDGCTDLLILEANSQVIFY